MRAPSDSMLLPELTRLITKVRRALYVAAARELGARGEQMSAWIVAARLIERRAASQKDLAEITGQHPAGISRLLDEMDRRGLTARALDPLDQRRRLVTLTPSGRRWHRKLEAAVLRAGENVLGVLELTEQLQLRALLRRIGEPRLLQGGAESRRATRRGAQRPSRAS